MDNREKFDFDSGYMDASETARQNLADIGITEIADKDTFFKLWLVLWEKPINRTSNNAHLKKLLRPLNHIRKSFLKTIRSVFVH